MNEVEDKNRAKKIGGIQSKCNILVVQLCIFGEERKSGLLMLLFFVGEPIR